MSRVSVTSLAGVVACGMAVVLVGCSGGSAHQRQSGGTTSVAAVRSAMNEATSVHVTGHLLSHGSVMTVDLSVTRSGDLYGTVTQGAIPVTILETGGKFFIQATKSSLALERIPQSKCRSVCGKYLAEPPEASNGFASVQMAPLLAQVAAVLPSTTGIAARKTTFHGRSALTFNADGGTLDIASGGQPYPLLVIAAAGKTDFDLSDWNRATVPPVPTAAQVAQL